MNRVETPIGAVAGLCYFADMAAVLEKQAKRWTYEEYYRLDDDQSHEIIDGNLLIAPSPDMCHQDLSRKVFRLIDRFVTRNKLGEVFYAPFDVVLDSENTVQPDLIFVSAANVGIIKQRAIFGIPNLLIELISPSSVRRDRSDKKDLYARFGVKEYWIGDPANKSLEILTLKEGRYELHCAAEIKGKLTSPTMTGLEFDMTEIQ